MRVSTDAQFEEGYSAEAQAEMLTAYCVSRRIENYELFIDGGWSGSTIDRPEIKRLIDEVNKDLVATVVVYKLDRLSRSQKDTLYLIEDVFNPHGVSFVSLNENMDTSTPIGRAMLGIMSAFAQLERETIRERTRMGMKERIKRGLWRGGGKIPFGYDYDREKGILVPNADAETVKLMYDLYIKGWPMMKIARAAGLKYEHLARQILTRKTNTGVILYNGTEYRGMHEAIVSEETYNRAMELMKQRGSGARRPSSYLLAGLVVCGVCGTKMRYQKWGDKGCKIYCYSQDSSKSHISHGVKCDNHKVWANEIENAVISDIFRFSEKRTDSGDENAGQSGALIKQLQKQCELITKKLKRLYNLYAESGNELLLDTINENRAELEKLREKLAAEEDLEAETKRSAETAERLSGIKEAWEYMSGEEKRAVIRECVEKVVITYDRVDIFYRAST